MPGSRVKVAVAVAVVGSPSLTVVTVPTISGDLKQH